MVRVAAMGSCVAVFLLFLAVLIGYCFTHKGNDEDVEGLLAREPLGELDVGHVPHAWHSDRIARLIDDRSCDELLVTILNTGDNARAIGYAAYILRQKKLRRPLSISGVRKAQLNNMSGGDPFDERFMRGEVLLLLQSMKLEVPDNWLRTERRIVTEDACW